MKQSSGKMSREDANSCPLFRDGLVPRPLRSNAKGVAARPGHESGECRPSMLRHCERSEAIQAVSVERFWIASLRSQ